MKPATRVMLWAAPKTVSTAFERSMRTLDHCKVFHEPYVWPCYQREQDYSNRQLLLGASYEEITVNLLKDYPEFEAVFAKDLAKHVQGKFDKVMQDGLSAYTHTFLIRRPDKAIYSWYTCGLKIPNWKFNSFDAGFQSLYELYVYVHQTKPVIVVDADDLLNAPDRMMEAYCSAVGIRYKPGMTSWKPGMIHDWLVASEGYSDLLYQSVAASSGFTRCVSNSEQEKTREPVIPIDLPEEVSACIRDSWPLYQEMYAARLVVQTNPI